MIRFHFTEEQQQFRDFLRRFLDDTSPPGVVREIMEGEAGFDAESWRRLATELALPGLCVPERYGGSGFGVAELGIAMEEMGRALFPSPFLASAVMAAKTIEFVASDDQCAAYLPAIASGEKLASVAFMASADHHARGNIEVAGDGGLTGCKRFVLDGAAVDQLLVVAEQGDDASVYLVDADAAGVTRRALTTIDQTRRMAEVAFDKAPAVCLGAAGAAGPGLARMFDLAYIALANESVGGAQRLFDDTLEYLKLRRQFGRSIASFQAIKHRMADLLLTLELAKSAAYYAAQAWDDGVDDISELASLAKAGTSDAHVRIASESIQLHGGIGFTWENDTHLWFKRAKGTEVLLGAPAHHRARMVMAMAKRKAA